MPLHSVDLRAIARDVLERYGFRVDFPVVAQAEADRAQEPSFAGGTLRDLSGWLWSSIDNDDSRDLDQIEYLVREAGGWHLYVGIANVDYFAAQRSALDQTAQTNTTSLYTGVQTVPMLPERLSTQLSSLLEGAKRLALIIDLQIDAEGRTTESTVYPAIVQNQAQLTYHAVAAWLEDPAATTHGSPTVTVNVLQKIRTQAALQEQLRAQDQLAQILRQRRHEAGALTFQTIELRPSISSDGSLQLETQQPDRATQLIEDFMIAANRATASFLESKGWPGLRRVVRVPKRWDRIIEVARERGASVPAEPDAPALEAFLHQQAKQDPDHFPDLSLTIIKLLGRGEYVVRMPGQAETGHFSLAVDRYSHSTAPNRRYPDLITQRLLLAACNGSSCPYPESELQSLAQHCTQKEDDANKAERSVHKSIAAFALRPRIGETFSGFITGASDKGTWVRLTNPPVEGYVLPGGGRVDVGDRVQVRLEMTDPARGFIDFKLVG